MNKFKFERSKIIELRDLLGYSQKDFADKIGITQGALSQIESGKSNASFDTLRKISDEFNINCNWLIKGIGDVKLEIASNGESLGKQINMSNKVLIPLIKEEAHAGYIDGWDDEQYIKTLDVYQIPGFEQGNYRLFEVVGDSMEPTIRSGEIVVCEFIDDPKKLNNDTLCVLISKDGIVAKRIYYFAENEPMFLLKSDNEKYKTYSLEAKNVLEIWAIKAKITRLLPEKQDALHAKRIEKLEDDIRELKNQVDELKVNRQE